MNRKMTQFWAATLGLAILATATPILAQGGGRGGPGGGPGGRAGQGGRNSFGRGGGGRGFSILRLSPPVQERLKLTADQKSRIEAVSRKAQQDVRSAFRGGDGGTDRQAAFEKVRTINSKAEAEALKVLNPTQKKQYDALKSEAADYAGLGRTGNALLAVPDLTAEQKSRLKALATQAGAKRDKLFSGGSAGGGDRSAAFQKMRDLDAENTAAVKKILTPAQAKKFDAVVAAGGRRRGGPGGPGGPGGQGGRRPGAGRTE